MYGVEKCLGCIRKNYSTGIFLSHILLDGLFLSCCLDMVISMDCLYELRCQGFVEIENDIWFSNWFFNALVKIDKMSGYIQYLEKFPNYDIYQEKLYADVCYVNGWLVFVPNYSDEIVSYNIIKGKFNSVKLDIELVGSQKPSYKCSYVYGKYVYMFPQKAKYIVRYDVTEHSIKYFKVHLEKEDSIFSEDFIYFFMQYEIVDQKIYLPFVGINAIAIFNLVDESLDIKYLNIEDGCLTINYVNECFYLSSRKGDKIYRWNVKTNEIEIYDAFPKGFESGGFAFNFACIIDHKIFFFPLFSNMIISLDIETGILHEEEKLCTIGEEICKTYSVKKYNGKIYALMENKGIIDSIDHVNENLRFKSFVRWKCPYNKKMISNYILKNGYYDNIIENKHMLKEYIEALENSETLSIAGFRNRRVVSDKIWEMIKS